MKIIEKYETNLSGRKEIQLISSVKIKNEEKESIGLLLYTHTENEIEIYDVNTKNIHKIPSFNETGYYLESLLVKDKNKQYIQLKRIEFSLTDYNISIKNEDDLDSVEKYVKQHVFYDALLIEGSKLSIIENHKEDTMLSYKDIKELMIKNTKQVYSIDIKDNKKTLSDFVFNKNYLFEYGKYIENNKKCKKMILNISKEKGLDYHQLQLMKLYDFYIYSNFSSENILNKECISYKLTNASSFYYLYNNEMVKKYLKAEFNLPKSYEKIQDLEHLDLLSKIPLVENTWASGAMDNFFNIRCYKKYIDSSLPTTIPFTDEMKESLIKFYNSISFKELQKIDIIYSKKVNSLLKKKINIIQHGKEEGELYIYIFDLFSNKGNLQTFVKNISPINTFESEKYDNTLSINVSSEFILKEDYLTYNVLNVNYELEYLQKKNELIDYEKMVNRLFERVHRKAKNLDTKDSTTIYLTGEEINDLFLKVFNSKEILEKAYIQLFNEITKEYGTVQDEHLSIISYKKTNLDVFAEHLGDILEPYFLMYYIYKHNLYNKKFESYFKKFFNSSYSNFRNFEEGLRELEGVLKSADLVKEIPLQPFKYPNELKEYEMKQPKNGFELKYIGDTMRHCVFSYFDRLISKDTTTYIVSILKENEPIVCIEIRNKSVFNKENSSFDYLAEKEITQAKLKYNSPVLNNIELNKIVYDFALLNNLDISTRDVKI